MEIKDGVFHIKKEDVEKFQLKPWWPGDPRVEEFMPAVSEAIKRHIPGGNTDIYNRAYEAVHAAIVKYADKKAGQL